MKSKLKQLKVKVKEIRKVKEDVFLLSFFSAYLAKQACPGNFLHLKINSVILRRPFSIHKVEKDKVFILFRVRGKGTKVLSESKNGDVLDIIGPLGKGFEIGRLTSDLVNVLVAGGIGVAPLMFLAQKLDKGKNMILLGAKNKKEVLCEQEFKKLGFKTYIATEDGIKGIKGTVLDLLKDLLANFGFQSQVNIYSCGPAEMFYAMKKIVEKYPRVNCQVSFEQFMGCGLGTCCGCTIETKNGYKKVCKDGPVFDLEAI
ncbi:MAG: dihydroorotate dehydrogenase electron transfer subunit [Candidatus Omnitrophota bacterium]